MFSNGELRGWLRLRHIWAELLHPPRAWMDCPSATPSSWEAWVHLPYKQLMTKIYTYPKFTSDLVNSKSSKGLQKAPLWACSISTPTRVGSLLELVLGLTIWLQSEWDFEKSYPNWIFKLHSIEYTHKLKWYNLIFTFLDLSFNLFDFFLQAYTIFLFLHVP